jgi:hypothetical protein
LPTQFLDDVRRRNNEYNGAILAEILCDSNHNANLHPPLVTHSIIYPGIETDRASTGLDVKDLSVIRSIEDPDALSLVLTASGETVMPLDLGFLSSALRPALFQLLTCFSPPSEYGLPPTLDSASPNQLGIHYSPRIVVGRLVAARRSWTLAGSAAPGRMRREPEFEYFRRVNDWRQSAGLPRQVYARVKGGSKVMGALRKVAEGEQDSIPGDGAGITPAKFRAFMNSRKPQFIDFASPAMVKLFDSLVSAAQGIALTIEERYPTEDMLPVVAGQRRCMEQILQIDLSGGKEHW